MSSTDEVIVAVAFNQRDGAPAAATGTLRVEVRDTGEADGPSITVASAEPMVLADRTDAVRVPLTIPRGLDRRNLTVFAHCDRDDSGRVGPGDWLTTQSYPLGPEPDAAADESVDRAAAELIEIRLDRIG